MDELLNDSNGSNLDFSLPLEVTFIDELAQDYGGPRKEFLGMAIRETRDRLFEEDGFGHYNIRDDVACLRKNYYFGGGLVFGKLFKHCVTGCTIVCTLIHTFFNFKYRAL